MKSMVKKGNQLRARRIWPAKGLVLIPSPRIAYGMTDSQPHTTHIDIVARLRRAEGHLRAIIEMIEAGRSCLDIAQQMQAVEKAVAQAKKTLVQDHIEHCLEDITGPLPREQRQRVEDFKHIAKFL